MSFGFCFQVFALLRFVRACLFVLNVHPHEKMDATKNAYFHEIYNICLKHFLRFREFPVANAKNHENRVVANFQYHFRNRRIKIRKYTQYQGNRRFGLFESLSFCLNLSAFLKRRQSNSKKFKKKINEFRKNAEFSRNYSELFWSFSPLGLEIPKI